MRIRQLLNREGLFQILLKITFLRMRDKFPQLKFDLEGSSSETVKLVQELTNASIAALFLIYILIAIPLKSYMQPIIIMSVIPFGLIGAVIGHIVLNEAISMFSLFGLVALAGVVVNDSIIMVDFINKARQEGMDIIQAVVNSGTQRFRAIYTYFTYHCYGIDADHDGDKHASTICYSYGNIHCVWNSFRYSHYVISCALSLCPAG